MNSRQAANVISGAFRREYERRTPDTAPLNAGIAAAVIQKLIDDGLVRPPATMAEVGEIMGHASEQVPLPPVQRGWGSGWRS